MIEENESKTTEPIIETLSELIEGESFFDSHGYAVVKITKDGTTRSVKIPIKSTGVAEYQEKLSAKAPRPPVTFESFRKGSEEAKAAGSSKHAVMYRVFDTTDEKYIDDMEKHNQDFLWKVAAFAVNWDKINARMANGQSPKTIDDKIKILKSNGVTGFQVAKIARAVNELTQFAEDSADFLSENG